MKNNIFLLSLIAICFFLSTCVNAELFNVLGPEAMGVGGAYTAVAESPLAYHWNPAGLALQKGVDLQLLPPGLRTSFTGDILLYTNALMQYAMQYSKIKGAVNDPVANQISVADIAAYVTAMKSIKGLGGPGNGILIDQNTGANLGIYMGDSIGKCTLTVNNNLMVGVKPNPYGGYWIGESSSTAGIIIDTSTYDMVTTSLESPELEKEIIWLKQDMINAGVKMPSNITNTELANALVNQAYTDGRAQGKSDEEISQELNENIQLLRENKTLISEFIDLTSQAAFMEQNSSLFFRSLNLTEIALSGSWAIYDDLYMGASLKMLNGIAMYSEYKIDTSTGNQGDLKAEDVLDNIDDYIKTSIQPGVDLGIMYDLRSDLMTKFGLVVKNINSPKFTMPDVAKKSGEPEITLSPLVRFGAAFYPIDFLTVSLDADLTKNTTLVTNYYNQMVALGLQCNALNFESLRLPLRLGVSKNIARDEGYIYSGGFGFKLLYLSIDASMLMSTGNTKTSASSGNIPADMSVQTSISLNF